jgi:FkbM family methyltransferase
MEAEKGSKAREELLERAYEVGSDITVQIGDLRFLIDPHDKAVGGTLLLNGARSEFGLLRKMVRILGELPLAHPKPGPGRSTFVDVGANIGTSTIPALMLHGFDRAVACEPAPKNLQLLRANLALNDLTSAVRVLPAAVADAPGTAELLMHSTNSGGHRVRGTSNAGAKEQHALEVEQITLDWAVERGIFQPDDVSVVWIDAQGFEGHILAGASTLTASGIPLVCEYHPRMLESVDGRIRFEATVRENYTHFVDLRAVRTDFRVAKLLRPLADLMRPVTELDGFADELAAARGASAFTDLLVARLEHAP